MPIYLTLEAEQKSNEPYFHRNVMQKIEVTKVSETFNERVKKLTEKIFINNKDLDFLDYLKGENEYSLSPSEKIYFEREKERNISIISLFLGTGIRVNELSNLRIRDIKVISIIRKGNKKLTNASVSHLKFDSSVRPAF